jgi:hypothetical protein
MWGRVAAARLAVIKQHPAERNVGMSMNWLEGMRPQMEGQMNGPDRPMAMPVFAGQKLVVVGGSSGMGRQTAADVVAAGGSAVVIGQDPAKVEDTVQELSKDGPAHGITADLADREQVDRVRQQLADEHADATAYEFSTGHRLASGDFEGGKDGAVAVLGKLGFTVQHKP